MTYYIKFDNGNSHQSQVVKFDQAPEESGWFNVGEDVDGKHWKLTDGSPVLMTEEEFVEYLNGMRLSSALEFIRIRRNQKLLESDWTQFESTPLSPEKKSEWAVYRQALRDFPNTVENPFEPNWPTQPSN